MMAVRLRRALVATAAGFLACGIATPGYATDPTPKWCEGVKIAAFAGGWAPRSGDYFSDTNYNGYRQAEFDLGPSVTYYFSKWDPKTMLMQLSDAIDNKVDGIVLMGLPGDAAADALIDKAYAQGTIVTTTFAPLPDAEKTRSSQGMDYVGIPGYSTGFAIASEAARRAGLKAGDGALLWAYKGPEGAPREPEAGMIEALNKVGAKVITQDIDPATESGSLGPSMDALRSVMGANPGIKLVIIDHPYLTANVDMLAGFASLKPGQVYFAGLDVLPRTIQSMKAGYLNLSLDSQRYLQGYLPILNICLTKKFGFSGLDVNTAGGFVDSNNVDAMAPLIENSIR